MSRSKGRSWDDAMDALLKGKTIRIPGFLQSNVTGHISQVTSVKGKYKVNVRTTPEGIVTWLTEKEQP